MYKTFYFSINPMVTSMLEKAIEIEGLLRIIRDGDPLPETYILLNMKAAELAEQAESLEAKANEPVPETPHADFVMAEPEVPTPIVPEVVFSVTDSDSKEETFPRPQESLPDIRKEGPALAEEDLSLIEEDDIILTFEDTSVSDSSNDFTMEPETTEQPMEFSAEVNVYSEKSEGEPDSFEVTTTTEQPALSGRLIPTEESTVTEETVVPEENAPDEMHADEASTSKGETGTGNQGKQIKLKSAFSLNDRFLYSRELFEGNMKMFDSTLEFIEGIEDYSIIEDYFYSELEWDPEDSNVATFMDILRPHFKE